MSIARRPKQTYYFQEALQKESLEATWDSESEFEEEVESTHVYFMANENTPKVTYETTLDDSELSMDELGEAFEELSNNYDFLKKKYFKAKKENELLQNQLLVVSKEKNSLSISLQNTQKDFDAYKISCKAKFFCFDENGFL